MLESGNIKKIISVFLLLVIVSGVCSCGIKKEAVKSKATLPESSCEFSVQTSSVVFSSETQPDTTYLTVSQSPEIISTEEITPVSETETTETQPVTTKAAVTTKPAATGPDIASVIESIFKPLETLTTAKPTTTQVSTKSLKVNGYTRKEVMDYFCDIAFNGDSGIIKNKVIKWTQPVRLYVAGNCNERDIQLIDLLCKELNKVTGFPGIKRIEETKNIDIYMIFAGSGELARNISSYNLLDDGYCGLGWATDYSISNAVIGINSAMVNRTKRDSVICEELIQSLGLTHDSKMYKQSVFYDDGDNVAWPTLLDWSMVYILYNPGIKPGMNKKEVLQVANDFLLDAK